VRDYAFRIWKGAYEEELCEVRWSTEIGQCVEVKTGVGEAGSSGARGKIYSEWKNCGKGEGKACVCSG